MSALRPTRTLRVSVIALFGSLSAMLTLLPLDFPFPLVPYLRFDLAEIPVFIVFMLFGPLTGLLTSATYLGVLVPITVGEWLWPIGPLLKFFATSSQVVGMYLGYRMYRILRNGGYASFFTQLIVLGMLLRIIAMTIANYLVLAMTSSVEYVVNLVRMTTGWSQASSIDVLIIILALTAVFNALHTPLSMMPAAIIVKKIFREGSVMSYQGTWMARAIFKEDTRQIGLRKY